MRPMINKHIDNFITEVEKLKRKIRDLLQKVIVCRLS